MSKKLRIPHLRQPKSSMLCVPTCCRMALRAFGHDATLPFLAKAMKTSKTTGTNYANAAIVLGQMGLETIFYYQPYTMPARFVSGLMSQSDIRRYASKKGDWWQQVVEMIDAGVEFVPRHATIHRIATMIDKGYVPIISVRSRILVKSMKNGYRGGGHALIVRRVDFKNNRVHVIDPGNHSDKKESYTIDHFEASRNFRDTFVRAK